MVQFDRASATVLGSHELGGRLHNNCLAFRLSRLRLEPPLETKRITRNSLEMTLIMKLRETFASMSDRHSSDQD